LKTHFHGYSLGTFAGAVKQSAESLSLLPGIGSKTSGQNRVVDAFAVKVGDVLDKRCDQRMRLALAR
jgi:hypothetical protein